MGAFVYNTMLSMKRLHFLLTIPACFAIIKLCRPGTNIHVIHIGKEKQ